MAIVLNKPSLRLLGAIGFLAALLIYQGQSEGFIQQLLIPLLAATCAWLACQNLSAVAFGTGVFALLGSNFADTDLYAKFVYPVIGMLCLGYLLMSWSRSFRTRIEDTREERWRNRRATSPDKEDNNATGETGSTSVNLGPLNTDKDTKGNHEL